MQPVVVGFVRLSSCVEGAEAADALFDAIESRFPSAKTFELAGARLRLIASSIEHSDSDGIFAFDGWASPPLVPAHIEGGEQNPLPDGSFIAAAYDPALHRLTLIVSKFGSRPLYYLFAHGGVLFADDTVLLTELVPSLRPRKQGILEWCHYGMGLSPLTLLEDVRAVPPGHKLCMEMSSSTASASALFDPASMIDSAYYHVLQTKSDTALEQELDQRFDAAVRKCIGEEKEVSILLSGGVDSSYLTAVAARHTKVRALTVDIVGGDTEVEYARKVANHLGVDLQVSHFDQRAFRENFVRTINATASPVIIENAIALYHIATQDMLPSGGHILDGEGADALYFGTIPLFKSPAAKLTIANALHLSTARMDRIFSRLVGVMDRLGLRYDSPMGPAGIDLTIGVRMAEVDMLTQRLSSAFTHIQNPYEHDMATLTMREFFGYMIPLFQRLAAMAKVSKSTFGLPFLETDFFRFSVNLPVGKRIGRERWRMKPLPKKILKTVVARQIPPEVVYRPKVGFGIPGGEWAGGFPENWIADSWVAETFDLSTEAMRYKAETLKGKRDMMYLQSIEIWGRMFGRGIPFETINGQWLDHCGLAS